MEISMKNKILKPKFFLGLGAFAMTAILGLSFYSNGLGSAKSGLQLANSGLGICFQRVTQSFTALMIRDTASNYITKDFRNITGECFQEVSNSFKTLSANLDNSNLKALNNLKSDLHWFDKKIDRVNEMASQGEIDIYQSNITRKYSELESLKLELEEGISSKIKEISTKGQFTFVGTILAQVALLLSGLAFYFHRKIRLTENQKLENILERSSESTEEHSLYNIIQNTLQENQLSQTGIFLIDKIRNLEEQIQELSRQAINNNSYREQVFEIPEKVEGNPLEIQEEKRSVSDFSMSLNAILDRVYNKAFNSGILLDTNLSDDFSVFSDEDTLQQLLSALVNYSMDQAGKQSDGQRKVSLRSKSLGGIAYCKVGISNYHFNEEELAFFNGSGPTSEMSLNLILLKEMCKDANVSIALRNKQNSTEGLFSGELELIFDRAIDQDQSKMKEVDVVKVVKGKKAELLKQFKEGRA